MARGPTFTLLRFRDLQKWPETTGFIRVWRHGRAGAENSENVMVFDAFFTNLSLFCDFGIKFDRAYKGFATAFRVARNH